jgi:Fe-S-cluster containining protein
MDFLSSPKPPWYVAGLAFECQGCGRCCAGPQEGYVWLTLDEAAAIASALGIAPQEMLARYTRRVGRRHTIIEDRRTRDCIFLCPSAGGGPTARGCRIYAHRPVQCRTWPFWPSNLRSPEAWACAADRCPGINRGRLYSHDEIDQRRLEMAE